MRTRWFEDKSTMKRFHQHLIPDDWEVRRIGKITRTVAGGTPNTSIDEYWGGDIPWMSSGELNQRRVSSVKGRITSKGLKNSSTSLIPLNCVLVGLAGQGKTRGTVAVNTIELCTNQSIAAIFPSKEFLSDYLFYNLDLRYSELRQLSAGDGGRGGLNLSVLNSMAVPFPPLPEQKAIARVLGTMDEIISKTNRLIQQIKLRKKYLTQTLLTGKKRLKGFRKKWKTYPFRELATESVFRNGGKMSNDRLMAVFKVHGMIPMRERVQGVSNHRCKVVRQNYFAYNPMRLNIGSLARWDGNEPAMVSGDYVVFKCEEERLDPRFFDFYRSTNEWANYVRRAGDGSVRVRIYFSHLAPLKINLPSIEEQKAIANILDIATCELTMLEAKSELLKMQKRWLMQQLLTGKKRLKLEEE